MEQLQEPLERRERSGPRGLLREPRLDRLRVPVAEVVECEAIEPLDGVREVEPREIGLHLGAGRLEAREDPALLDRRRAYRNLGLARAEQEPRHVPELDRELAALLDRAVREAHVLRRGHLEQPVARGIGAVCGDHLARVRPGTEALRHPPAVRREQRRVDDHVVERHLAEELEA